MMEKAKRIAEIDTQLGELREQGKALLAERAVLETDLIDGFAEMGISKVTIDGRTVYVYLSKWARIKDGDRERAVAAAQALGLGDAVTVNMSRVSAFVREQEQVPTQFLEAFEIGEKGVIRSRRA